jgi:hypothetical protein
MPTSGPRQIHHLKSAESCRSPGVLWHPPKVRWGQGEFGITICIVTILALGDPQVKSGPGMYAGVRGDVLERP